MNTSEYPIELVLITFFGAAMLILAGTLIRKLLPIVERMHLPASVVGGVIGLIIGPQLFGAYLTYETTYATMKDIYKIGKAFPGYLIVIVFAALMMGKAIPSPRKIMKEASPHLVVGYSIAWGQYVVGAIIALLVLIPFFDANPLSAALIAIGFQGGYGTAAGLAETYGKLGFEEGYDMALGMATAGKVSAIMVGLALINFAVNRDKMSSPGEKKKEDTESKVPLKEAKEDYKTQREEKYFSADVLVLHFGLLCVAILIGWGLREALFVVEGLFVSSQSEGVMQYIPLFPMALIGGIILQLLLTKSGQDDMVNQHHLHSISHSFLDLLIVLAIASLSLVTIIENWAVLLVLIATGIGWNLIGFFFIAPRFYKNAPWTRGLGDFAHSTGATTTGLLLMKIVDPSDSTGARSSFNLKQSLYEPIIGGGFITALALPLIHTVGLWATVGIFTCLLFATLLIGYKSLKMQPENPLFED